MTDTRSDIDRNIRTTVRGWAAAGLVAAALGFAGTAQAVALINLGNGIIRDPSTNLEWLANANLAATETFDVQDIRSDGSMTWITAQAWIAAMNTANYLGHNDWRLPLTAQPDTTCSASFDPGGGFPTQYYGYNCTGSELGDLFYNKLGGKAGESVLTTTGDTAEELANLLLFDGTASGNSVTSSTIQSYAYWSGTEYAPNPRNAWFFYTEGGDQVIAGKASILAHAWAVRAGQAAVPEPGSLLLLGAGLAGLVAARRRRQK